MINFKDKTEAFWAGVCCGLVFGGAICITVMLICL